MRRQLNYDKTGKKDETKLQCEVCVCVCALIFTSVVFFLFLSQDLVDFYNSECSDLVNFFLLAFLLYLLGGFFIGHRLWPPKPFFFFFCIISSPLRNKLPGEKLGVWDPSGCQYCPTDALRVEKSGTFSPQGSRQP